MSGATTYTINVTGNVTSAFNGISSSAASAVKSTNSLRSALQKFGDCAFAANNVKNAVDNFSAALDSAIKPGVELDSKMADLSAITGVTGDKLKEIEGYARQTAKTFGGSAAQGVESFKLILSQLGPEIAKNPVALKAMGDSVALLSKTMGGDTIGATEVLTTAMNQFQVSLDDPARAAAVMADMMNVMGAAAKEGSAELPQIKAALENSGMAAKMAGVSFEELNASIQVLDKAGKKGAEGGIAIRNVLSKLSQGRFMPKDTQEGLLAAGIDIVKLGDSSLTFKDRLNLLKPVMNDAALLTKMFGEENKNAALALISGTSEIGRLTTAVAGTKSVNEQAQIVMGSFSEKMGRIKAGVEDFGISLFNLTKGAIPALKIGVIGIQGVVGALTLVNMLACASENSWMVAITSKVKAMWQSLIATKAQVTWAFIVTGATVAWTVVQWALNAAFIASPIGWVVLGIGALVAGIVLAWNKFEGFRAVVLTVWDTIKGFGNILKEYVVDRIKGIISGLGAMGSAIYKLFTGDFKGAWESAKQGAIDLSGYDAVKKAVASSADLVKGIGVDYQLNLANESAKGSAGVKDGKQSYSPFVSAPGIAPAAIPGLTPKAASGSPDKADKAKATTDAIASGGTRNTSITMNIKSLIENVVFDGSLKEKRGDLEKELTQTIMRVLGMVQATS
ncbi:MAG: phage tail tape measure protein [Bacteroidetes bacterium]|nr:phage tail tape measure protein [Bacteroidota bacterium]